MIASRDWIAFEAQWIPMMAAMMAPSVALVGVRYSRVIRTHRVLGHVAFIGAFLTVWAATGVPAWLLGQSIALLPAGAPLTTATAGVFALCGVYQFTPFKHRCLAHCRAPHALLLRYAAWRGSSRHWRVGLHHGMYCVGCCWPLFAIMTLLGAMSLGLMLGLTAIIVVERTWTRGDRLSQAAGAGALLLAGAVLWHPELASHFAHQTMNMAHN